MTSMISTTLSDGSREFYAQIGDVGVAVYRDGISRGVRAAVYVTLRGALTYRISAHSRKNSLQSVFMWVRDFKNAANSGDESAFYDLLADAKDNYMSTELAHDTVEVVVFNLDCEAE